MRQCLFLNYGWFLQNLEKGCIRTNMHTTVAPWYRSIGCWHMGLTDTHYYESISLARRPEASFTKGTITQDFQV